MKKNMYHKLIMFMIILLITCILLLIYTCKQYISNNTFHYQDNTILPWMYSQRQPLVEDTYNNKHNHNIITIEIQQTSKQNKKIYQQAINKWNSLNIIHFKIANTNANIIISNQYVHTNNSQVLGRTENEIINNHLNNATIKLSNNYYHLNYNNKLHVILHELGHSLGFNDSSFKNKDNIMQQTLNNYNYLGNSEKQTLLKYYNK